MSTPNTLKSQDVHITFLHFHFGESCSEPANTAQTPSAAPLERRHDPNRYDLQSRVTIGQTDAESFARTCSAR